MMMMITAVSGLMMRRFDIRVLYMGVIIKYIYLIFPKLEKCIRAYAYRPTTSNFEGL